VEVITTRTPADCSCRATAKPIPSALPAPVTIAVCLLRGKCMGIPRNHNTLFKNDFDSALSQFRGPRRALMFIEV